jgi:hypothetical protein
MTKMRRWALLLIGCLALGAWSGQAVGQTKEKVYRSITPAQMENILADMGVKYTKTQPKNLPNDWDFEFKRNGFDVRFTVSQGTVLWLSAFFPKPAKESLEKINQWNVEAKFSRAVLDRVADRDYAVVETQLDGAGGVTENMIKQFIRRFDDEVSRFDRFIKD